MGYLTIRRREMSWNLPLVNVASAILRGAYQLYQALAGFIRKAVMGKSAPPATSSIAPSAPKVISAIEWARSLSD